ncbi:glycosyltransferase [Nocardioides antri]|uniref:Glycosyltransferase family 4 protein n=1 Tax=Nocardioides antri TaxID=2607659 RepID=A0A5B1LU76_9ACTN|nr:glycosyltransferase [Nocardioides antri]KAA1424086.1 glycosyltransferase family 4 protein [Nocardioides antri]
MGITVLMNAGPWLPVPPAGYGGIETVVATLVPELRSLGLRVVLASVATSSLEADDHLAALSEPQLQHVARPYNQVSGIAHAHMQAVVRYLQTHPEVDLVHDHLEVVGPSMLAAMSDQAPPALQTLHWDLAKHPEFYSTFDGRGRIRFAAVSRSQVERAPANLQRQIADVIPLAVPPPLPVTAEPGDHVVVLARITRDKGQDVAVRACLQAGVPVVLAGPVAGIHDPAELRGRLTHDDGLCSHADVRFFLDEVAPHLDGERARWVGGVDGEEKERLLQSARALLAPIRWAEPGATAVVEALVRGIPVVASPRGVHPSLVDHGRTGFLAATEPELVEALTRLGELDPRASAGLREDWEPRRMAERYVDLYEEILEGASA